MSLPPLRPRTHTRAHQWDERYTPYIRRAGFLKALVWFWLIDETLSANLVYQDDSEIGSTTPSDEAMAKIMTMVMVKCLNLEKKKEKNKRLKAKV